MIFHPWRFKIIAVQIKIITESLIINNHVTNNLEPVTNPKHLRLGYSPKDLKNLPNHLTQFYPSYSIKLTHWFLASCIIASGLGFWLTKTYALTMIQTISIKNKNAQLTNQLQTLKKKTEVYRTLQNHTNDLTSKITCMTELTQVTHDPASILSAIGETIPQTSWLTGVKIRTRKQQKNRVTKRVTKSSNNFAQNSGVQKQAQQIKEVKQAKNQTLTITIQGTTPLLNDTTRFIHNLSSSPLFKNSRTHLKHHKLEKKQKPPCCMLLLSRALYKEARRLQKARFPPGKIGKPLLCVIFHAKVTT